MATSTIIKNLSIAAVGSAFIALGTAGAVQAKVLTFDDISTTSSFQQIPNSYGGFDWTNFYVIKDSYLPGSGYENGTISGNYTVFNGSGKVAAINKSLFDFNGAYLTAAWNNGLNILVEGFLGGVSKYSQKVVVNTDAPTFFNFDFLEIDQLKFTSSGGTNAGLGGSGEHFVMDNFTFNKEAKSVPEPSSVLALLAASAIGAGSVLKRKKQ